MTRKITLLLFVLGLTVAAARAQSDWKKYKVDDALSVKFPGAPARINGKDVYFKDSDSTTYYVYVEDFGDMTGLTGDELVAKEQSPDLANAFKDDLMSRMPGYTLGSVTIGKWKDYVSYSVSGGNEKRKYDMYVFAVFIQDNCYYLIATLPASHTPQKKDVFFGSVSQ